MNPTGGTATPIGTSTNQSTPLPQIVIDLEKLRHINCGLGRFSLYLARELLAHSSEFFEPVFFLPKNSDRYFENNSTGSYSSIQVRPWKKERFQKWIRPIGRHFNKTHQPALWHVTHQLSKYLPFNDQIPVVLTVHDLNFLHTDSESHPERTRRQLARIQKLVTRATAIVTDSQFVADDLARHIDVGSKPNHVIPLGLTKSNVVGTDRPHWMPEGPFLFSIGNFLQHKNFQSLVDMMKHLSAYKLIVAGKTETPYGKKVFQKIKQLGLTDRVLLPGMISDVERAWLYQNCDVFVFPSLTEGFGFPVLEAMQFGKPVVMSNRTSLPEIAGDSGFFFTSYEAPEMAKAVMDAVQAFQNNPSLAIQSCRHAERFSWQATAQQYADVYRTLLKGI
jgi:glycosyltransferase involved in cell wall biosynthesis